MSANVIAIDGPAASGKSSVAKIIAERLRIPYISTGALYRALAWKWKQIGHSIDEMTSLPMTDFLASTGRTCSNGEVIAREGLQIGQRDYMHISFFGYRPSIGCRDLMIQIRGVRTIINQRFGWRHFFCHLP